MSSQPIVDPHNPLYCPSIPANMYLSQVLHPIRNQRPKSQANKMNLNILTSSRIRKGSTRNSGSISSFVRMLHHWHDSVLRSKEKEGLASNSNDCMDFGPPRIVESMKNNSKTHHRMNNIVAASRSGPRTRAKSRAQTRNVDDGLPSKDHVVPSLTTSNPASPAVVMKKGAHKPSAVASSKSGSLIRPFWDISGSSDSTLASPTFSVAQVGNETELNILPPGLRSDQEHSGLVDTLLIHPTLTAPVTTKPKTMILKSLLRRAVPAITLSTRVQSDDTSQNYQCSIFDLKSRKRKLEELFPDLLIPSESSGTKRHKGIQINASPRGALSMCNTPGRMTMRTMYTIMRFLVNVFGIFFRTSKLPRSSCLLETEAIRNLRRRRQRNVSSRWKTPFTAIQLGPSLLEGTEFSSKSWIL
ncbi:hypothetical protein PM082_001942 [Marasmius tenuissimus]|nr:hypothetical protein PM082_001942 [Marasmius tenuissimus]